MSSGKFVLQVRETRDKSYGELETFSYDDGSLQKNERRDGVLAAVPARKGGWQSNYADFSDASFRIIEKFNSVRDDEVVFGEKL